MRPEHLAVLARVPLLAGLDQSEREQLAGRGVVRRYPRGQVVFSAGDPAESLVVVLSGRAAVGVRSADGGSLMLQVVGAGESLGELGVVDGGTRSAELEALEATEVLLLPRVTVLDLLARHPAAAEVMMRRLADTVRRLTEVTADLVFLDLPRRVAKLLLEQEADGAGRIELRLNQEQLAHRVGGTRQSVNAALKGFERRGWVRADGGGLVLEQRAALQRFVGPVSHG